MNIKTADMSHLFHFEIMEDYILNKEKKFYFFRLFPPNTSIMTHTEMEAEVQNFQHLLDSLHCGFQVFVCDQTEDLTKNKEFFEGFPQEYDYLTSDIISAINSVEISSKSIQRAYYLVFQIPEEGEFRRIHNTLVGKGYSIHLSKKKELSLIIRNFLLREFNHLDMVVFEEEERKKFQSLPEKKKKKQSEELLVQKALTKRLSPISMEFKTYDCLQNDFLRKVIMVKNIPTKDLLGYMKGLSQFRNTSFSMQISPMEEMNIAKLVNAQTNSQRLFNKNKLSEEVESKANIDDIGTFYQDITRNKNKVFLTSIFIEIYGADKESLKQNFTQVATHFKGQGITYDVLPDDQKAGFLSVYPLGKDYFSKTANNLPSNTLASLYPFSYSSKIDKKGLLLGETVDGGNLFVDFFLRDSATPNGNITIIGTSGSGKTYLQKKILNQLMMSGVSTFTLDAENEYAELYKNMGGTVINCSDNKARINVFEVRQLKGIEDDQEEDGTECEGFRGSQAVFFQHLSWLKDFFSVLYPNITPKELSALMIYVQHTYNQLGLNEITDFTVIEVKKYPTFTDLYHVIEEDILNENSPFHMIHQDTSKDLLLLLKDVYDGALGFLLNGHTNIQSEKHICFSILDLLTGSTDRTQAILFNILTYVWNKITLRQGRIAFDIDELHIYLENKNIIVGKYIKDFCKRVRKYGSLVITATQNFSDVSQPDIQHITMGIFNNSNFKFIFFPGQGDIPLATKMLRLEGGEVACISRQEQQHCLLKAGKERFYMKVGTLPYEEEIFGKISSGKVKEA